MNLTSLLQSTFGFPGFRANQEAVCHAATDGRDVLLVMPTGAGKSLCYQLPALARGGPALVISPLIALMDDQAAKLSALGLRVARIHSGLPRDAARQACRDYLDGFLQFLFIAPERMRVPGFPQMLARRTPSLVAIDEAHCISAWGHDFRPDYRTLGEHLPALRPAPIVALTATATPTVQRDIAAQLALRDPALFIHGFRRSNLAIEVVEMSKPQRNPFVQKLLRDPARRPAIVYAPSRKAAEELAADLHRHFPAAAYHAGLDPATRERVQTAFLSGSLEIVVATIAFGMGIDKADVRTVLHTALPASVEAFYQEIGRAGRDGLPATTVLLHSFADRKMHEFFLDRDYPPVPDLERVARALTDDFLMPEPLARDLKMDPYQFQKAIEKLVAQGAATIDVAGNVRRTTSSSNTKSSWRAGYEAQIAFRRAQLDAMAAFAETPQCRMSALIRHFGDTADGLRPCGHCDVCAPQSTHAQTFREPSPSQSRALRAILAALRAAPSRSTGKLFTDLAPALSRELGQSLDRRDFDLLLDALTRAGLLTITSETFTNPEGNVISYKKAALTHEGRADDASDLTDVLLPDAPDDDTTPARKHSKKRRSTTKTVPHSSASSSRMSGNPTRNASGVTPTLTPAQQQLEQNLRAWRKAEAAKTGKPAFLICADSVLTHIAAAQPRTLSELLTIPGIGQNKADTYGAAILTLCRTVSPTETPAHAPQPSTGKTSAPKPHPAPSSNRSSPGNSDHPRSHHPPEAEQVSATQRSGDPSPTYKRDSSSRPDPAASLTPSQQALDLRLRDWRKAESERLNLPQFFLLGSSTLRAIVLARPDTLDQLRRIEGIDAEKLRQFGPALLELCASSPA